MASHLSCVDRAIRAVLLAATASLFTACGGGSGGPPSAAPTPSSSPAPAPTPVAPPAAPALEAPSALTLTPTAIKTFRFTWASASGAGEYRLLEDPDGTSGYQRVATLPASATQVDHEVFLPERVNARYIVQACQGTECRDSAAVQVVGNLVNAVGYVKATHPGTEDQFGGSLAISGDGNTLAVGAPQEDGDANTINGADNNNRTDSGAVYVYARVNGTWQVQAYVKPSNPDGHDLFGTRIALSHNGDTLAVGSPNKNRTTTGEPLNGVDAESVHVFTRSGTQWTEQAIVKASNATTGDEFGYSLALSADGNTLAVGARLEDSAATGVDGDEGNSIAHSNSGAAYVYRRNGNAWTKQAYLKASNTGGADSFGYRMAISADGHTLAVAAQEDSSATGIDGDQNNNDASSSGAVYVFTDDGGAWHQQAYIKASNTGASDEFGHSLALSSNGSTLAVGAPREDSAAMGIDGDQLSNVATNSGAVYVFARSGNTWLQQAYVKASNSGAGDQFGYAVSLSGDGNTLAVGAVSEDSAAGGVSATVIDNVGQFGSSGAAYLFKRAGTAWQQKAYIKAPNTGQGDQFGTSLALAADGEVLAVGALVEDGAAQGIGGDQASNGTLLSGAVYLY